MQDHCTELGQLNCTPGFMDALWVTVLQRNAAEKLVLSQEGKFQPLPSSARQTFSPQPTRSQLAPLGRPNSLYEAACMKN